MNEQNNKASNVPTEVRHEPSNVPSTSFGTVDLLTEDGLNQAKLFLAQYITSEKGGIKSIADGIAILARAQDLKLPFTTCVEHIHVINHKTGVDVHIIKSLLLRAGVSWERVKDYTPQYNYTDGTTIYLETQLPDYCVKCRNAKEAEDKTDGETVGVYPVAYYKDLKGNIYNEFEISDKCVKALNIAHANKIAAEGNFPIIRIPAQPVDFVTEFKFNRKRLVYGQVQEMTCYSRFSYSEAVVAEFFVKDTYKKYARIMIDHRAFTLGARDIADDLIMGVMESSELGIINDDPSLIVPDYTEVVDED